MILLRLSRAEAEDSWPLIKDMIQSALNRSETRRTELTDIYDGLLTGRWQAWVILDIRGIRAALITEIFETPLSKVANIFICTGEGREEWEHLFPEIVAAAKKAGCTHLVTACRPGWSRMLRKMGMRETHREMEMRL